MMKPLAVVLAIEPGDYVPFEGNSKRQNVVADAIRANFAELIKLPPAERKARIDQILKPERTHVRSDEQR
jgi:hypothetical protein